MGQLTLGLGAQARDVDVHSARGRVVLIQNSRFAILVGFDYTSHRPDWSRFSPPIIAGVFLPDCWMEGLLSAGISKRWAAFDGESGRALGVR